MTAPDDVRAELRVVARRTLGSCAGARRLAPLAPRRRLGDAHVAGRVVRSRPAGLGRRRRRRGARRGGRGGRRRSASAPGSAHRRCSPTASDELKRRLLPRAITGEDTWCQLFSEPGSGSDLAGLTTRATLDGDEWVIDGQKLWSTSAHHADLGLLLARTDWDVPKHRGITCFALPMRQPGVEARPVRQMNGHASFNEVFLTGARVPADHMIGEPGEGWRVAMTTLAHERGFATLRRRRFDVTAGRAVREAAAEAEEYFATYAWYPQRAGRADLVDRVGDGERPSRRCRRAPAHRRTRRPAAGPRLDRSPCPSRPRRRARAGRRGLARQAGRQRGRPPRRRCPLVDRRGRRPARRSRRPVEGIVAEVLVSVPAQSIAGGTDEIQHNIIGEKVLGLPREPSVDRELPFRSIPR